MVKISKIGSRRAQKSPFVDSNWSESLLYFISSLSLDLTVFFFCYFFG
jgi:hypothetical protein